MPSKAPFSFGGLKAELRAPKVISEYVRTYLEEVSASPPHQTQKRQRLEQQQGQLTREIDRLVNAIAKRARRSGYARPAIYGLGRRANSNLW
jgi:site-specific DNA recombinase